VQSFTYITYAIIYVTIVVLKVVLEIVIIGVLDMTTLAVDGGMFGNKKSKKLNFLAPESLVIKIGLLAKENKLTESDFIRQAIARHIEEMETKKFERELEEGYKANYDYYLNMDKEWQFADGE